MNEIYLYKDPYLKSRPENNFQIVHGSVDPNNVDTNDDQILHGSVVRIQVNSPQVSLNTNKEPKARCPGKCESPVCVAEASDLFLDPALYSDFSISSELKDLWTSQRFANNIDKLKEATRNKAVDSISASENLVYWLVNSFKYLINGWLGLIILLVTIAAYGALGAFIFVTLEGPHEKMYKHCIEDNRKDLAVKLEKKMVLRPEYNLTQNSTFLSAIKGDLEKYEMDFLEYYKHVFDNNVTKVTWDFWNSYVYAGTIFTTIGYGHIYPKTKLGQGATILYAIFGIPLFLIVLASFGKYLTRVIKFYWGLLLWLVCGRKSKKAKKRTSVRKEQTDSNKSLDNSSLDGTISTQVQRMTEILEASKEINTENDEEFNLPITVAISILVLYILVGAVVVHYVEKWDYFESFYYVFISMSTIGLGDKVVSEPIHMVSAILYIIFGLSLTAMCIEVVQKKLTVVFHNACEKFKSMIDKDDSNSESVSIE